MSNDDNKEAHHAAVNAFLAAHGLDPMDVSAFRAEAKPGDYTITATVRVKADDGTYSVEDRTYPARA